MAAAAVGVAVRARGGVSAAVAAAVRPRWLAWWHGGGGGDEMMAAVALTHHSRYSVAHESAVVVHQVEVEGRLPHVVHLHAVALLLLHQRLRLCIGLLVTSQQTLRLPDLSLRNVFIHRERPVAHLGIHSIGEGKV